MAAATDYEKRFWRHQMIVFGTLFIGYACYAYNRKSVSAAMPQLIAEGLDKSQAGEFSRSKNIETQVSDTGILT